MERLKRRLKPNDQQGFSLLELLIYVSVLSLVAMTIAGVFLMISKGRAQIEARVETDSNLSFAVEKVRRDLAAATALVTPNGAGAASGTLEMTVGGANVKYFVASSSLWRQVNSAAAEALTSSAVTADSAVFTRLENSNQTLGRKRVAVEFVLTVSSRSAGPDWQYAQSKKTTVDLRPDL